jgi:outer membrane protein assembly factor BamB
MRVTPLYLACAALFAADDDWPRWRGPNDDGMARGDAPLEWSDTKNIAWRVAIPGRGHSSPILWGDQIFLTTAVPVGEAKAAAPAAQGPRRGAGGGAGFGQEHKFVVMSLDRKTGKVLWERVAKTATPHEGYHGRYGSFASNSPVTDGKYLYAFFGSRGLYCFDLKGKLIWEKQFPPMRMRLEFGEGVPTVIDENAVYLKFDQQQGSYMLALDKRTGKELWRVDRSAEESSWSPPLVLTHNGRKQVVVSATNRVRSYDPQNGKVIWEAVGLGSNVIPSPVTSRGMVYVMSGHRDPNLLAIRLGREGDLTGTDAIAWTNTRGNSYSASPVLHDDKLYFVTDNGVLSCLNAQTGQPYYQQQRLPKPYTIKASPVGAAGKLYISTEDGDVVVVKMGEKYEALATNSIPGEFFIATPAIAGGSIYLRGVGTLYCIRQ